MLERMGSLLNLGRRKTFSSLILAFFETEFLRVALAVLELSVEQTSLNYILQFLKQFRHCLFSGVAVRPSSLLRSSFLSNVTKNLGLAF